MDELTRSTELVGINHSKLNQEISPASQDGLPQPKESKPLDFKIQVLSSKDELSNVDLSDKLQFLKRHLSANTKPRPSFLTRVLFPAGLIKKVSCKISGKKIVEILRITHACQGDLEHFRWGWIDSVKVGDEVYGSHMQVAGWLVGKSSQPVTIKFIVDQTVIAETPVNIPRPDVVKAYFIKHANCGYNVLLETEKLCGTELLLQATFPEGHTAQVGSIWFRKYG